MVNLETSDQMSVMTLNMQLKSTWKAYLSKSYHEISSKYVPKIIQKICYLAYKYVLQEKVLHQIAYVFLNGILIVPVAYTRISAVLLLLQNSNFLHSGRITVNLTSK